MKHILNILILLILSGFAIGVAYLVRTGPATGNVWGVLFIPIFVMMLLYGDKVKKDYK